MQCRRLVFTWETWRAMVRLPETLNGELGGPYLPVAACPLQPFAQSPGLDSGDLQCSCTGGLGWTLGTPFFESWAHDFRIVADHRAPPSVTKEDIMEHFKSHGAGTITEVKLMNGFGFIEYDDAMDARDVVPGNCSPGFRSLSMFADAP